MKRLILAALAATSMFAVAAPALAHDRDGDDDWSVGSYEDFGQQYHHIWLGIRHGLSDGSYTPWQARYFAQQLRGIQMRADWEARSGQFDADEINGRLASLHARMHVAHERGHERLDNDWGYGDRQPYYSNGYRPW